MQNQLQINPESCHIAKHVLQDSAGFNVVSLFDGMSCGRIALEAAGIPIKNYFSSEISPYAIKASRSIYNNFELGDVQFVTKNIFGSNKIDILIGGSPCQDLRPGRNGLKGEKSKLFYEYYRLLKELKPKYFLLENVSKASKEDVEIISNLLGVRPIRINSSLVSAQNRDRLYWTNIKGIKMPKDKGIFLKDIVQEKNIEVTGAAIRNQIVNKNTEEKINIRIDGKSNCVVGSFVNRLNLIKIMNVNPSGKGQNGWVYDLNGKSPTVTTNKGEGNKILTELGIRKLTPYECGLLQTIPKEKLEKIINAGISNARLYEIFGNGWTIDVISHIFSFIEQKRSYEKAS